MSTPAKSAIFLALSLVAALTAWLAEPAVSLWFKGLPVLALILDLGRQLARSGGRTPGLVAAGLVASLVGDYAIEVEFIAGIAAFAVAHLLYIAALGPPREGLRATLLGAVPALILWTGMGGVLVGGNQAPEELQIPVLVYMTIICTMLGRAVGRALGRPEDRAALAFAVGAAVFALSDSLIATDRWLMPLPAPALLILLTYYAGQAGIRLGVAESPEAAG